MTQLSLIPSLLSPADAVHRFMFRRPGSSPVTHESDWMFMYIFWLSTAIFIGLMGLMAYWVLKYRWKPGQPLIRSRAHNTPLEITWTVIPTIVLVAMFFQGFRIYAKQQSPVSGALVMQLTGMKWSWSIMYPNGAGSSETTRNGAVDIPVFLMPEDTPIKLEMISEDVIHSFWIPDFRFKQDVFPNRKTTFSFRADPLGPDERDNPDLPHPNREMWVFCAEYCGDNHSEMAAIIRIVPKDVYAKWSADPWGKMSPVEIGQKLWAVKGCNACHTVDGGGNTGPTWLNLAGYEHAYTDGSTVLADSNHIRDSILNPGAKVRTGFTNQMPSYAGRLTEKEINALLVYMNSISDKGQNMGAAPAADAPEAPPAAPTPPPASGGGH